MAGCKHECKKTPVFPQDIFNRPALDDIDYRIGSYSRMREHMLDLMNSSVVLSGWTHRAPDDPGIALLEGNAIVGDILTFYQNLYANQAFLRSADWRESVADLVQLLGYRLAPGVGGEATFALKVKGKSMVTVPKGFGFKAQLENREQPDELESTAEVTAYPHLSEFNLYRPPLGMQTITADGFNRSRVFKYRFHDGVPDTIQKQFYKKYWDDLLREFDDLFNQQEQEGFWIRGWGNLEGFVASPESYFPAVQSL